MKIFLIVLIIIFSHSVPAQEKDSSLCHYGFVMDYQDEMINQIGFKYRQSETMTYFFKGKFEAQKPIPMTEGQGTIDIRTYGGSLGVEYTVHTVDNLSISLLLSGGVTIHDYTDAYFIGKYYYYLGNFDEQQISYTLNSGLTIEYFFSHHISVGCNQLISFNLSKANYALTMNPEPGTYSRIEVGKTSLTLSFYF
ncbi:MAG: hypothetical protein M0P61_12405 [Ignavibacteriaceae bacterium]|jgi:hypothetical protein|nr:hypothetical protein [Ignavibacteriaceae bacterium]